MATLSRSPDAAVGIAARFVEARLGARGLPGFPGALPADLAAAYAVQDAAIGLWPTQVAGWKVAGIHPDWQTIYGATRLAGPAFTVLYADDGGRVSVPVFAEGFAAVEAEFAFVMARDLPPRAEAYSEADLRAAIAGFHGASEVASSPLAAINELGPASVISDFGNNAALVLGPPIPDWQERDWADMVSLTRVDGVVAGEGNAGKVAGGPIAAAVFLANHLSARGRTLSRHAVISTGMTTGIHPVRPGSRVEFAFGTSGAFAIDIVAAEPAH